MGSTLTMSRPSSPRRRGHNDPNSSFADKNRRGEESDRAYMRVAPPTLYPLTPLSNLPTPTDPTRVKTPIGKKVVAINGAPTSIMGQSDSLAPPATTPTMQLYGLTAEDGAWPGGSDRISPVGSGLCDYNEELEPAERPLNPDLPTRNALFIFANFASFMRAPNEGAEDVRESALKHAQRLLEHARELRDDPKNRVNVLHIKYRFPVITMEKQSKGMAPAFPTLTDPVIKLDYKQDGGFRPIPTAAILRHIAREIDPPPRTIVYSYVASKKTSAQLAALAAFCDSRRVPITVVSPSETRIREHQPPSLAIGKALDLPLYATLPAGALAAHASGTLGRTISGNTPYWATAPPPSGSGSGGSYIRAKEGALKRHGVISSSYLSVHGSMASSAGGGGPVSGVGVGMGPAAEEPGRRVKVARLKDYEAMIDALRLGDVGEGEGDVDEGAGRTMYGYRASSLGRTQTAVEFPGAGAASLALRKASHVSSATAHSSGSSRSSRGLRPAAHVELAQGTMFWRNMVLAHADPSNPEYAEGRVG